MVEEQGHGVSKAAKKLRIKVPTAKVILSNYRKKGRIYSKKNERTAAESQPEPKTPEVQQE